MYHRPSDADLCIDFVKCECDVDPVASVAIDEFGYFVTRRHGDDFHRMVAFARLGGQRCLCMRALEMYRGERNRSPKKGMGFQSLTDFKDWQLPIEWQESPRFLAGLRLRRRLPKLDPRSLCWSGSPSSWLASALKSRGWLATDWSVPGVTSIDVSVTRRSPTGATRAARARFSHRDGTAWFDCRVYSFGGIDDRPYVLDPRSPNSLVVGVEAILLMHGFDRRVE
jgi:hypothetical protein